MHGECSPFASPIALGCQGWSLRTPGDCGTLSRANAAASVRLRRPSLVRMLLTWWPAVLGAGADPGPACYGQGGTAATVTDANLVLGLLDPDSFLGGRARLDRGAAEAAIDGVAAALGVERMAAAEGIRRVIDARMAEGIRLVSVRRGVDPRRFAMLAFGGAAGLHVTAIARQLGLAAWSCRAWPRCSRRGACSLRICATKSRAATSATPASSTPRRLAPCTTSSRPKAGGALRPRRSTVPSRCIAPPTCATASRSSRSASLWTASTGRRRICSGSSPPPSTAATRSSTPTPCRTRTRCSSTPGSP